jgi:hypothetical protein
MDEILIEEKKYISSKQAAKITGYAKDYIGQLCREGRVPARLVGRGWYVLETAIQDHRFGNPEEIEPKKIVSVTETPRYYKEDEDKDLELPPVNQLRKEPEAHQNVQDSWREWFDRFDHTAEETVSESAEPPQQQQVEENKEGKEEDAEEKEENIPIHAVYQAVSSEQLPHRLVIQSEDVEDAEDREQKKHSVRKESKRSNKVLLGVAQMVCILLAAITVTATILGSGYLDKYVISFSQVSPVAGVLLYNR